MNGKNIRIVCVICLLLFMLAGCCTTAAVYDNREGAYAVRAHIGELNEKQADSAITSERLNGTVESARAASEELNREITKGREHSEYLEHSITDGTRELEALTAIVRRIRARGDKSDSGEASDNR